MNMALLRIKHIQMLRKTKKNYQLRENQLCAFAYFAPLREIVARKGAK
jgi:hypothetical protein